MVPFGAGVLGQLHGASPRRHRKQMLGSGRPHLPEHLGGQTLQRRLLGWARVFRLFFKLSCGVFPVLVGSMPKQLVGAERCRAGARAGHLRAWALLHAQPWHQLAQLPQELTVADWGASIQLKKLILDKTIFFNCKIVRTQNPELSMPDSEPVLSTTVIYI